jgi:hypothetical protein
MRKLLPVFYVFMVLLFCYQTFDEFSAPDRTKYRIIAGVMAIMGAVFCAIMAWGGFQNNRDERSSQK